MKETVNVFLPLILFLGMALCGCASNKAGVRSPELPPRHWLDEAPGVPVENKEKLDAAVPNLYAPNKVFDFEECVFLTIQQSPQLVNSAVDIEIKRLALTDAVWKYIPEPRMTIMVSNNLTRYNMNEKDLPGNYGRTQVRAGFYAALPNPIATYFEHKVQNVLLNIAISTHRKAVGAAIFEIARAFLTLQAQREMAEAQRELLPLGKEVVNFWQQVENVEGKQGVAVNLARQSEREAELRVEKTDMQEVMERTRLKVLAGVDPHQKFEVDTTEAKKILAGFNGYDLRWEDRWQATEDDMLLRAQVKLGDYRIMVAWAQYVPDLNIQVNSYPPAGQYQPPGGQEDMFLHLNFDFPLLDWGRHYRGVQTARMEKAQAFQEMGRKRTDYSNRWLEAEQAVALATTEQRLARNHFETAEMQLKEARIAFNEGLIELPELVGRQQAMVSARLEFINAELQYNLAILKWMYVANVLQERFLGLPLKEVTK